MYSLLYIPVHTYCTYMYVCAPTHCLHVLTYSHSLTLTTVCMYTYVISGVYTQHNCRMIRVQLYLYYMYPCSTLACNRYLKAPPVTKSTKKYCIIATLFHGALFANLNRDFDANSELVGAPDVCMMYVCMYMYVYMNVHVCDTRCTVMCGYVKLHVPVPVP